MNLSWSDKFALVNKETGTSQDVEVSLDDARNLLLTHPHGPQEVIKDVVVDFTDNAAKFKTTGVTVPAGSILKYVGAYITELVVAGGTTVKLALGVNDGDVDAYLTLAALTLGTKNSLCLATAIAAATEIDLDGILTDGSALGDNNVTAGKVRVVIIYDKPATMTAA